MIWLLSIVLFFASHADARPKKRAAKPSSPVPANMTKVGSCANTESPKKVLIIKQWHLAPTTVTKGFKEKYPQERNQTAIYTALASKIKDGKIQLLVSEGCEGEINKDFKPSFNGWDYESLHKIAQTKGYEKIISLVPLKLEARFDDKVRTMCGDSDKLIQEGNLRISNLRGWFGFWTRLNETYPDDKGKLYSDAAAELLKVPKDTPKEEILKQIRSRVKDELDAFKKSLDDRNDSFVKVLKEGEYETAAIVAGGLHAEDLKEKVQAAGLGCEVLEPPGYQREDEQLILDFEKIVNR